MYIHLYTICIDETSSNVPGEVGDWKNHLTVAQNEMFDAFIKEQEKKGVSHTFQYE